MMQIANEVVLLATLVLTTHTHFVVVQDDIEKATKEAKEAKEGKLAKEGKAESIIIKSQKVKTLKVFK
jgi:hypothetical protein